MSRSLQLQGNTKPYVRAHPWERQNPQNPHRHNYKPQDHYLSSDSSTILPGYFSIPSEFTVSLDYGISVSPDYGSSTALNPESSFQPSWQQSGDVSGSMDMYTKPSALAILMVPLVVIAGVLVYGAYRLIRVWRATAEAAKNPVTFELEITKPEDSVHIPERIKLPNNDNTCILDYPPILTLSKPPRRALNSSLALLTTNPLSLRSVPKMSSAPGTPASRVKLANRSNAQTLSDPVISDSAKLVSHSTSSSFGNVAGDLFKSYGMGVKGVAMAASVGGESKKENAGMHPLLKNKSGNVLIDKENVSLLSAEGIIR
ncbi:hypothetical protein M422DRAFT_71843 [Sphaerobolus stellatus SS14]|uniref:Unplaced genomic scaffold SPHSTscaffold_284, whole genome shotgun sequence n=1 Tax=Sphaerobolus stellatus (strain SS14) TaxID=990650 RepID=A0A0C9UN54_SPHS4|nr:hypothetical protein M422DRAFT_71843 [Sphaerobolus stellatus SS14]